MQSTCAPTNDNLMELMIMADAIRRASATGDRGDSVLRLCPSGSSAPLGRVPISAKVVADMLGCVGIDRMLTVDLHADQIQGFFNMPVDNVYALTGAGGSYGDADYENPIIVSPDVGGVVRARAIAKQANDLDLAIIDKRGRSPTKPRS